MGNKLAENIQRMIGPEDDVLDLCCGILRQTKKIRCRHLTGIDKCEEYIKTASIIRPDWTMIVEDVFDYLKSTNRKWDVILCIDGIEHLEKETAVRLLDLMEILSNKQTVVFTPTTFTENHPKATWGIKSDRGDELQKHRSFFGEQEMIDRGYAVLYRELAKSRYTGKIYENLLYSRMATGS